MSQEKGKSDLGELSPDQTVSVDRWQLRLSLGFRGIESISDYARAEIEKSLINALGELACELDGDGFISWVPDKEGLLAEEEID